MGGLDDRQSRFVDQIVSACEDIDRLVDDLSLLGRVRDGRLLPQPAPVALADIAERAVAVAPPSADGRRVELDAPRTAHVVEADIEVLARAVGRLAGAALRLEPAAPAGLEAAGWRMDGHGDRLRVAPDPG